MDISDFDVILGMDWLKANRVVIDFNNRRITTYTPEGIRVTFQRKKHDALLRWNYWDTSCRLHVCQ